MRNSERFFLAVNVAQECGYTFFLHYVRNGYPVSVPTTNQVIGGYLDGSINYHVPVALVVLPYIDPKGECYDSEHLFLGIDYPLAELLKELPRSMSLTLLEAFYTVKDPMIKDSCAELLVGQTKECATLLPFALPENRPQTPSIN